MDFDTGAELTRVKTFKPIVSLDNVHKAYGKLKVVNGLSLRIYPGEVIGFLGRNGAGKSTVIKLIMGITQRDSGNICVFDQQLANNVTAFRQRIGYVAQEQYMYPWMTPKVIAKFVKGFYPSWDQSRFQQLVEKFDLPLTRRIGTFSGGMKARLALSLALSSKPELLILDEPTAGMDPVARREFLSLVKQETGRGDVATFFSTHLIDEVEALATRLAIVEDGACVYDGTLNQLKVKYAAWSLPSDRFASAIEELQSIEHARFVSSYHKQDRTVAVFQNQEASDELGMRLQNLGWAQETMSLEDVFVSLLNAR